jgi:hypothetical protein
MVLYLITAYMIDIYIHLFEISQRYSIIGTIDIFCSLSVELFTINKTVDLLALTLSKTFGGGQIQII